MLFKSQAIRPTNDGACEVLPWLILKNKTKSSSYSYHNLFYKFEIIVINNKLSAILVDVTWGSWEVEFGEEAENATIDVLASFPEIQFLVYPGAWEYLVKPV